MPISIGFFNDAGLTTEAGAIQSAHAAEGSSPPRDRVVYLGSTVVGKKFQADSNPGVDPIVVSVADSAIGAGIEASAVKLATSLEGLDSAVPGAALQLGPQILSGVANKAVIYCRLQPPAIPSGSYDSLSLATNALIELNA